MSTRTPFAVSRYEHDGKHRHIYYLPRDVFDTLETAHPTYLVGSRGTGKTTLLKALSWNERMQNPSLRQQISGQPFEMRYIGLYLRMPEYQLSVFEKWMQPHSDNLYAIYLALFVDLAWLELLAEAISELAVEGVISLVPAIEHDGVDRIVDTYPQFFHSLRRTKQRATLRSLSRYLRDIRRSLVHHAFNDASPAGVLTSLGITQIGEFGRSVALELGSMCDSGLGPNEQGWHFKPCLDESETLNVNQQRILNSIVRLSAWPVFPVVSYVGLPHDITETVIPNLTLQKADRHLRLLDQMEPPAFRDLAEGVSNVRVRHLLGDQSAECDLATILGTLDVNLLLQTLLSSTSSAAVVDLLTDARRMKKHPFFASRQGETERPDPIYQAYLIRKLQIALPKPDSPQWVSRAQDSAELRKRSVAAYLSICTEYGFQPLYGSAEMVLQLSDKCMRDFLLQMQEIFFEVDKPLLEFLSTNVNLQVQNAALTRASRQKLESIPRSEVRIPTETAPLVEGLGRVTAIVQTTSPSGEHLRSSERGTFEVQVPTQGGLATPSEILRLIRDAAEAGFLKTEEIDGTTWRFRVHTSLAAAFGFSYRGAYYPIPITLSDLDRLRRSKTNEDLDLCVEELGKRLSGRFDETLPLFEWRP